MTEKLLIELYFLNILIIVLSVIFTVYGKRKSSLILSVISLLFLSLSVAGMIQVSGHVPVSGNFEKYHNIVLYIMLFGVLQNVVFQKVDFQNSVFVFFALILMLLILPSEKTISENYLIYSRLDVVLFFQLRMLAMALFIYAISLNLNAFLDRKSVQKRKLFLKLGRNFTLLGASAFLGGELFGSFWALNGWGDPWRWSKGFFAATVMFLLSMLAGHIPSKYLKNPIVAIGLVTLPLLIIVFAYII